MTSGPIGTGTRASMESRVYLIGGGIASLAAAAVLVRDAGLPSENIRILEQLAIAGGSMDGAPAPTAEGGYVTRGGRMFEDHHYVCLWDLLETIPSLEAPCVSVRAEFLAFNQDHPTYSRARIILGDRSIADASQLGLNTRDRVAMTRLLALPEHLIKAKRSTTSLTSTSSRRTSGVCGARHRDLKGVSQ